VRAPGESGKSVSIPKVYRTRKRARASCCFSIFAKAAGSVAPPGIRTVDPSRQRPRRRGPFRRPSPVGRLSDSSVGSPFGLTRSGSTSELPWTSLRIPVIVTVPSPTVRVRCSRTGCDGCGRPTCDAGSSLRGPLFCDCAPGANGTFNLGSSCWWRHDPTGGEAVKEPTVRRRWRRPDGQLHRPRWQRTRALRRGSRDQSLIGPFSARRGTEHRLTDDVEARSH
jgi:hypothetical protein